MKRVRQKIDNLKHKRATKVDKEGNESGRFSEIEGIVADNPRKLRGSRNDRLLYEECFDPETEIIMSDYSIKKIGDVVLGDTVLGVDGFPKKVINVSRGTDMMYNITQNKGMSYKVNSKHQLCVVDKYKGRKNVLMTPIQYLDLNKTQKKTIYGECTKGVPGHKNCELDPYYFGV